jgi:hypothetical protein
MSNNYFHIEISQTNNLHSNIHLFIKKLQELSLNNNFYQLTELTNKLIDSLIDICIKNKIDYFINNNISFTSIKSNFKLELETILLEYAKNIYPYIDSNITEINSQILQNPKFESLWKNLNEILIKKPSLKNKVSFNPTATQYTYKIEETNKKSKKKARPIKILLFDSENDNKNEITVEQKISICIKIISINKINIDNLFEKIYSMCTVLSDPNIDYDIYNPYNILCTNFSQKFSS